MKSFAVRKRRAPPLCCTVAPTTSNIEIVILTFCPVNTKADPLAVILVMEEFKIDWNWLEKKKNGGSKKYIYTIYTSQKKKFFFSAIYTYNSNMQVQTILQ
jgi:hypothetical protein